MKPGDVIEVKEASKQLAFVLEARQLCERDVPDYIEVDHSKMTAKFARVPGLAEVPYAVQMEPNLVVEYLLALSSGAHPALKTGSPTNSRQPHS